MPALWRPEHPLAESPPGDAHAPTSWEGTGRGDREYIAQWRSALETRRKFEEKHPEHATNREAIAAHEGAFEGRTLTYRELADRAVVFGDATQAAAEASRARSTAQVQSPQSTE